MMKLKEISKDIYDVSALLDEELGAMGTPERQKNTDKEWRERVDTNESSTTFGNDTGGVQAPHKLSLKVAFHYGFIFGDADEFKHIRILDDVRGVAHLHPFGGCSKSELSI